MKPFVHLHNHTAFSLLDGAGRVEDEVKRAAELGMPALAITDHGVMYGAVQFYKSCQAHGIKPIIGCEVYVARRSRFQKESGRDEKPYHLILLVENEKGYHNLCQLVTQSYLEGFYYKPRIDRDLLAKHHEGLICLSACLGGELPQMIMDGNEAAAREAALWYKETFGRDNFYLELQNHGLPEQQVVNDALIRLGKELDLDLVCTNDNHYMKREDAEVQDVMLCIQTGKTLDEPDRMRFDNNEFYLKSYDDMLAAFPNQEAALDRTVAIADRCQFDFTFGCNHMPYFDVPEGYTIPDYLKKLCLDGLADHYETVDTPLLERLDKELSVIGRMGYEAYFLIVWDFVDYAKRNGIYVGPGRGSAAGSLVAYALGITAVDPIKYNLLFERFLNPERVNMPDIDIDFCYERRGEVIDYVTQKYGADHVSQIITFGTMAARGAVRDVGRVMNVPLSTVNRVCKLIPLELGMTIDKALSAAPDLRQAMADDDQIDKMIRMAQRLEGLPRHAGTHAAGVVISREPMTHYLPLQTGGDDGSVITQFSKDEVEEIGLLKMDFLGLRTLTVVNKTIELIEERHGRTIDFQTIDENDPPTYDMLSRGDSLGVFQLEGSGLRVVLKDLKPNSLEDIIALVALYRPGPLGSGMVDDFIARKHGEKEIEYPHMLLEDILQPTYGVILYQEQVMQIASRLSGFSLGEADMLRRAMGKKKPEIIEGFRTQFIEGALKNGVSREQAAHIFSLIEYFAGYGFNKSHSAAYGVLAFQTAWLKCHYPAEFMAELLNSFVDNADKVTFYIKECVDLGIPVLPPDINESGKGFTVTAEGIRFGLKAIRGVGDGPVEAITEARETGGPFQSLQDFCQRVDLSQGVNKRVLESLIRGGAFQEITPNKRALLAILNDCVLEAQALQKATHSNQVSLFDVADIDPAAQLAAIPLPDIPDYDKADQLRMEKELLGIYVSGHPLDDYRQTLRAHRSGTVSDLNDQMDGQYITLGGILSGVRFQTTKKGDLMAYAELEDETGSLNLLVFPRSLGAVRRYLEDGEIVLVSGKYQAEEDEKKCFVNDIRPLSELGPAAKKEAPTSSPAPQTTGEADNKPLALFVKVHSRNQEGDLLAVLKGHPGQRPVYFYYPGDKKLVRLDPAYNVDASESVLKELRLYLPYDDVTFTEHRGGA
ncbi:DNA polymerase III subunit alpha [Peptococcus simiae]|uniref:DNA polymerase III subunit alpha n=1 Tax=Peptococcus simiae TaxID=1643805 RepID=A0ABW9GZ70_9FIRM